MKFIDFDYYILTHQDETKVQYEPITCYAYYNAWTHQEKERNLYQMEHFDPIHETSYLSVPNAHIYRKIMRCFYREYEKMHFQLYKEDIFRLIKQDEAFAGYKMEQL